MPTAELELPRLDEGEPTGRLQGRDGPPFDPPPAAGPGDDRSNGSFAVVRLGDDPSPDRPSTGPAGDDALPVASVRALVIDDHAPSRVGLAALLSRQPWIERCWLAAGSEESVELARRHRPDVVILDVSQTGPFAGTITSAIRAAHPGVQILLSSRCRTSAGASPTSLGAVGFLPAGVSGADVVDAVRAAVLFGEPLEPTILATPAGPELTDREREILVLLGTGLTNREIGERLHLGPDSVKKTATGLYRKLGVRNRTEAARRAATILAA